MVKVFKKLFLLVVALIAVVSLSGCLIDGDKIGGLTIDTIKVTGKSVVEEGEGFLARATLNDEYINATEFIWSVTNSEVLAIDGTGNVIALKKGVANIVATLKTDDSVVGKLFVKVTEKKIDYTEDAPNSISIRGDKEAAIGTIGYYRISTTPVDASQDVHFESSNENIATVNSFGIVKFNSVGVFTLKCVSDKNENIYGEITISVVNKSHKDLEEATIEVVNNTKDSILGVANYQKNDNDVLVLASLGSGFVYDARGILSNGAITDDMMQNDIVNYKYLLITNKHVVKDCDALKIYIVSIDEEIPADLVFFDTKVDMAVVSFEYSEYIKPLKFGNSSLIKHGETVIAIGNPKGFEYSSSATRGIVSYPERLMADDTDNDSIKDWDAPYIQHDASINPGNSGGPLLNLYGEVIGINTLKITSGLAEPSIDNMGFSIPSRVIVDLLPYLENEKSPIRPLIGISSVEIAQLIKTDYTHSEEKYNIPEGVKTGLYIKEVNPGSVADGKLMVDDILMKFNGVSIRKTSELRAILGQIVVGSGEVVPVEVLRNGELITVELIF